MKQFFLNQNNDLYISIFSIHHILLLTITFGAIFLVIKNKNKFKELTSKQKQRIRNIWAIIIIINFVLRRGSFIYYGVYNYRYHLDIGFCNFTSIMFLIYALTGNRKVYNICYYMSFIGPLTAIMLPSVNLSPLNYSFYSFFILHHLMFIFNFIFLFIEDIKYSKENFCMIIKFLFVYFIIIFLFNAIFITEYNAPLTFVNINLKNVFLISYLAKFDIVMYSIYFFVVLAELYFAKFALNKLNKSRNK